MHSDIESDSSEIKRGSIMKRVSLVGNLVLFVSVVLLGAGCQLDNPIETATSPKPQAPQFLKMPSHAGLNKIITASSPIYVKGGGKVNLDYEEKDATGKKVFDLEIELKFDDKSVSNDFVASVATDANYLMSSVDLLFGPHETTFLRPAKLKVHVKGMDLSGLTDKSVVHLYYENNGTWELMDGDVKLNVKDGELKCDNGKLPHFSRYAFGY
jgi:hypothetical protein